MTNASATAPLAAPATSRSLALPFTVGSVLTILGAVGYIALNGMEPREAFQHPVTIPSAVAVVSGCLVLSLGLARWRADVPTWAVLGAAVGVALAACSSYEILSTLRAVAAGTDDATFRELTFESTAILVPLFAKSAILLVCLVTIGVTGLRRRALPKPAAVAFVVAGVVSLFPVPMPGLIVLSIALLLTARRATSL
ncbi:hypothetical protein [Nocardioides humi]|uniref:Uncharacterized protein n=1 Tax=Nocardioides humi TaxID=449461 RepID=A0ABN1ZTK2_9ACTN|nr:hypothetical protein [Nocardioides humi]